ncbi:GIN domain-containing protein [Cupriavidus sp. TMH.W2]|uniref:GIN domain-containing protein n=1 Tax=Cupriavidus sp. TMH.W2 TaxID=3434465 RepID=UPI003D7794F9
MFAALAKFVGGIGGDLRSNPENRRPSSIDGASREIDALFSEERAIQVPPRLRVSGAIEVVFHQFPESQLRVAVEDPFLLRCVRTSLEEGALVIEMEPETFTVTRQGSSGTPIRDMDLVTEGRKGRVIVGIAAPNLHEVRVSGDAKVDLANLNATVLDLSVAGTGRIHGRGTCSNLTAEAVGSGSIICNALSASSVRCSVSGAGSIRITATSMIRARATGSGIISVFGDPLERDVRTSGAGCIGFKQGGL